LADRSSCGSGDECVVIYSRIMYACYCDSLSDDEVSVATMEGVPPHVFNCVSLVENNEENEESKFDDHGSIYTNFTTVSTCM
jgi:hypothetical protein